MRPPCRRASVRATRRWDTSSSALAGARVPGRASSLPELAGRRPGHWVLVRQRTAPRAPGLQHASQEIGTHGRDPGWPCSWTRQRARSVRSRSDEKLRGVPARRPSRPLSVGARPTARPHLAPGDPDAVRCGGAARVAGTGELAEELGRAAHRLQRVARRDAAIDEAVVEQFGPDRRRCRGREGRPSGGSGRCCGRPGGAHGSRRDWGAPSSLGQRPEARVDGAFGSPELCERVLDVRLEMARRRLRARHGNRLGGGRAGGRCLRWRRRRCARASSRGEHDDQEIPADNRAGAAPPARRRAPPRSRCRVLRHATHCGRDRLSAQGFRTGARAPTATGARRQADTR